ncbi:hypothetical protein, partial [Mesorhizobium sp.]|uniref:hypothetical protein n=1 Tax=Mesorhizobium sp. TaxID=1871066 RepID=UPI0025C07A3B
VTTKGQRTGTLPQKLLAAGIIFLLRFIYKQSLIQRESSPGEAPNNSLKPDELPGSNRRCLQCKAGASILVQK